MKQSELNIYKYINENGKSMYVNNPIDSLSVVFHVVKIELKPEENHILSSVIDGSVTEYALLDSPDLVSSYTEILLDEAIKIKPELSSYIERGIPEHDIPVPLPEN